MEHETINLNTENTEIQETVVNEHPETTVESHTEGAGEVSHETTLFAEPVAHVGPFTLTNSLLTSWAAVLIIVILALLVKKNLKAVPGQLQTIFEIIIEGALDLTDQVTGNRRMSMKIFPIALSVFFFVLVNNWMGILPGVGSIGMIESHEGHQVFVPFLRGGTADINTTLALGILSVIGANIFGIVSIGIWKTFNKFFNVKILSHMVTKVRKEPTILIVAPVTFFVGLIELIGEFAKIASLSFRLFGNVFAGEVLLASMSALFAFGLPIPFLFLEVLVGMIQALIFAMLTVVYYTIAAHDHEEEHDSHGEAHDPHEELVEAGTLAEPELRSSH